jgi:hypothetical protein
VAEQSLKLQTLAKKKSGDAFWPKQIKNRSENQTYLIIDIFDHSLKRYQATAHTLQHENNFNPNPFVLQRRAFLSHIGGIYFSCESWPVRRLWALKTQCYMGPYKYVQ